MGPYTLGNDVPIGCRLHEIEGRLRRPLIHLIGGHRARRPWSRWFLFIVSIPHVSMPGAPGKRVPILSILRTTWQGSATIDPTLDGMPPCAHPEPNIFVYHKHHSNLVHCNETPCLHGFGRLYAGVLYLGPGVKKFRKLLSATVGATLLPPRRDVWRSPCRWSGQVFNYNIMKPVFSSLSSGIISLSSRGDEPGRILVTGFLLLNAQRPNTSGEMDKSRSITRANTC